ncbi:hypothetical protein M0811_11550 [Anaeramoeba ignava]|uniref:Uncharacterized protein n=1 Tax=Anaeramoeba ignava TaxID=1746090 RepID=A0A9Q0LBK4_ANAIG|nr:hypothetical protein M0811_11550 [Anaeramoeba ignava]
MKIYILFLNKYNLQEINQTQKFQNSFQNFKLSKNDKHSESIIDISQLCKNQNEKINLFENYFQIIIKQIQKRKNKFIVEQFQILQKLINQKSK